MFCSGITVQTLGQNVVINEVMAKNYAIAVDADGDYSDWIELYNASSSVIDLENYSLSDDSRNLQKWAFPSISIPPNGFLLVFASGKNVLNVNEPHTNFKISSEGEEIYLSNSAGILIDQVASVGLLTDEAFGQVPNGSGSWIRIATATPGSSNNSSNQLFFSHSGGFYTTAFPLTIQSHLQDTIYYTINGDIPTQSSAIYDSSIFVDESIGPNVFSEIVTTPDDSLISYPNWSSPEVVTDKAFILRCASFRNNVKTSKIYTKSFFVDNQIFSKYSVQV